MAEKVIHEIRLNQYSPQHAGGNRLMLGTSHSYGIERLHLVPEDGWDGLAVTATFHSPAGLAVRMLMGTDGMVDVPPEATASAGLGKIVISGVADDVQRISCNLTYMVMEHAHTFGGTSTGPTPDVLSQVLASTLEDRKAAAASAQQAEDAASAASGSALAADNSANWAAEKAAAAKSSADNAASSATAAKSSDTAAAKSAQVASSAETAAKAAQNAAETAKTGADTAASNASEKATAAANSAAAAKKTLESIPADYSTLSGKVDKNTSGISKLKEDLADKVPKNDYAPETKTESMTQPVGKDENGKLWTTPGSVCAVSSVNSKTGAVVLTADDVHAMRDDTVIPTVPDKVSAFENDAGYLTAHQDISGKLDADKLPEAVNDALAQAAASGEFDGADGKSAYQYAVEGGYTGTEAAFAEKLAQEQLTGTTDDLTPTQVYDAVSAGIPVKVQYTDSTYGLLSFTAFNVAESLNVIVSQTIVRVNGVYILAELDGAKSDNTWGTAFTTLAQKTDIPSALPNPNALTFTGAVTGSYDGSNAKTVNIPSAVTDDHINELINTALGVIENGSY